MSVNMAFGNVGEVNNDIGGFKLVSTGFLSGENMDEIAFDLSQHQMYILFTREITISSGAVRGFRARLYARTENNNALQVGNLYASSNAGVTMTISGETLTLKPTSTSYDVYYALYSVM